MSSNTKSTPNVATAIISIPNIETNGTGAIADVITGTLDGTLLGNIVIKSLGMTSEGMVRLFMKNPGGSYFLIQEVMVPASVPSPEVPSFYYNVNLPLFLKQNFSISASTENGDTFAVTAYGINKEFCGCPSIG